MMKKYLLILVSLLVILTSNIVFAVSFSDLTNEHWAYEPIIEMANKGILSGYPDGTFLPNKSITRAEFAKILVLSLGLKDEANKNNFFDDVDSSHWSYDYVRIASNYLSGYTNGSQIYFMPDEQAVREDMAVAIVMATNLQNKQYNLSTLDRFSDKDSISESFRKYVAIAVENNLMRGNADGTFNPKGKLTRAEVSQLMLNTTKELDKIVVGEKPNETATDITITPMNISSLENPSDSDKYTELFTLSRKLENGENVEITYTCSGVSITNSNKRENIGGNTMTTKVNGTKVSGRIAEIWGTASMASIYADTSIIECKVIKNGETVATKGISIKLSDSENEKAITITSKNINILKNPSDSEDEYKELFSLSRKLENGENVEITYTCGGVIISNSNKRQNIGGGTMTVKVDGTKVNGRIAEIWGTASMADIFADTSIINCKVMKNGKEIATKGMSVKLEDPYLVTGIVEKVGKSTTLKDSNSIKVDGKE